MGRNIGAAKKLSKLLNSLTDFFTHFTSGDLDSVGIEDDPYRLSVLFDNVVSSVKGSVTRRLIRQMFPPPAETCIKTSTSLLEKQNLTYSEVFVYRLLRQMIK